VLGGGKLAMALGGSGQGSPLVAVWSTAYLGPGPWGSLVPELPSHPAQLYEGIGTLVLVLLLILGGVGEHSRAKQGRLLLLAIGAWAMVRAAVSITWRDPAVLGPLPAGGVIAAGIVVGAAITIAALPHWTRWRARVRAARAGEDGPSWPDPETRPQF
jgi:prolipoprotein diacylglyceryltransferase